MLKMSVAQRIRGIRNVNSEVGFISLSFRENTVREEIYQLASELGLDPLEIRSSILGIRSAEEVARELEGKQLCGK